MVEELFLWYWDARPYPFWPDRAEIWSDGYKWSRGHWLNGKLSLTTLADILLYICNDSGIDPSRVDVSRLDGIIVDGFVIDHISSNKDYIEHICTIYNIEYVESEGMLRFLPKHDKGNVDHIPACDLLSVSGDGLVELHGHKSNSIPSVIECLYFDKTKLYQQNVIRIRNDHIADNNKLVINSNIVSTPTAISRLMNNIKASYLDESLGFKVYLPPFYAYLEPGDLINIHYNNMQQVVSITNIASLTGGVLELNAVSCNVHSPVEQLSSYGDNVASEGIIFRNSPEYLIEVLDIPNFYNDDTLSPVIYIAAAAKSGEFKPVQLEYTDNQGDYSYPYSEFISQEAVMGVADCINLSKDISPEIIDHKSVIRVFFDIGGVIFNFRREYDV